MVEITQAQLKLEGEHSRQALEPVVVAEVRETRYVPCSKCGAMIADRTPQCGFCGRKARR